VAGRAKPWWVSSSKADREQAQKAAQRTMKHHSNIDEQQLLVRLANIWHNERRGHPHFHCMSAIIAYSRQNVSNALKRNATWTTIAAGQQLMEAWLSAKGADVIKPESFYLWHNGTTAIKRANARGIETATSAENAAIDHAFAVRSAIPIAPTTGTAASRSRYVPASQLPKEGTAASAISEESQKAGAAQDGEADFSN
jgi:hypothetical protein